MDGAARLANIGAKMSSKAGYSEPIRLTSLENNMAVYVCEKCGMSIGTMNCGKCGNELQHSTLTKPDGSSVHISECPDGHGKVKSPMCCGQDMTCSV
jgi:hypothetical protein